MCTLKNLRFRIISLVTIALLLCTNSEAQLSDKLEFGLSVGPSLTLIMSDPGTKSTYSTSVGFYGRVNPYKDFKIGMSVEYQPIIVMSDNWRFKNRFDMLRFPIWIQLNINAPSDPKVKCDFILGYIYSRIVSASGTTSEDYLEDITKYVNSGLVGLEFEVRRPEKKNIMIALHADIINIHDWTFGTLINYKLLYRRNF